MMICALALLGTTLEAQTFIVLHQFTGGSDGASPYAGLTLDGAGNLYGTTYAGGNSGAGTVFKLARRDSGWTFSPLYEFADAPDGANPYGGMVFGPDGSLYGTTFRGGNNYGTVFSLRPPPATICTSALCPWTETVIHRFELDSDGIQPIGNVVFDGAGNLYGATSEEPGSVYELLPSPGGWTEAILYQHFFSGPQGELTLNNSGNLYGATPDGGNGICGRGVTCGTVFELVRGSSGWVGHIIHNFQGPDGGFPHGGVILGNSGNLYGASSFGGSGGGGTVFMLSESGTIWTFRLIYGLTAPSCNCEYSGPLAALTMDARGNLYDTSWLNGAYALGSVFMLTPSADGSWTYTDLHDFTGGADGEMPISTVVMDPSGNLYGTTSFGGAYGYGTVWEITL